MNYTEAFVQRDRYRIYAREYAGEAPYMDGSYKAAVDLKP